MNQTTKFIQKFKILRATTKWEAIQKKQYCYFESMVYKYRVSTKCFLRGFRKNWFIFYMQKNLSIYLSIYLSVTL